MAKKKKYSTLQIYGVILVIMGIPYDGEATVLGFWVVMLGIGLFIFHKQIKKSLGF